jgi:hypothetical protein
MFFSEPKAGEYRLFLESGVLCEYMEKMDKIGIFRSELELFVLESLQEIRERSASSIELEFELDGTNLDEEIADLMEMEEMYFEEEKKEKKHPGETKKPEKEL